MNWGYNTNGLAHHSPEQALRLLADMGYRSVAVTIDHHCLSPFDSDWPQQARRLGKLLRQLSLGCVVETGARYLLSAKHKHWPSLALPPGVAAPRIELIRHGLQVAEILESDVVSIWSGTIPQEQSLADSHSHLHDNLEQAIRLSESFGIVLGMEPEPGMLVERMADYAALKQLFPQSNLKLTLDIGHLWCLGELPLRDFIVQWGTEIVNVHLEDMRQGVHEHLMFGEGEIPFAEVYGALVEISYRGGVHVELSRHSHAAPQVAQAAFDFLRSLANGESRKKM